MNELNIGFIQTTLFWEDPNENRSHFESLMDSIDRNVDVLFLPEMFSTGFSMHPEPIAETMNGPTVNWMRERAAALDAVVAGSLVIEEDDRFYNRFVWMKPDGEWDFYDKRHLFSLAGEHNLYTAGNRIKIVEYKDWKFCLQVCYDLRFPVWSRNSDNYDVLVYVANWPETRVLAWSTLLRARAIENQAYVVGVNRVGQDGNQIQYNGQSAVVDMAGFTMLDAKDQDKVFVAALSRNKLNDFRNSYPFYKDCDEFNIMF